MAKEVFDFVGRFGFSTQQREKQIESEKKQLQSESARRKRARYGRRRETLELMVSEGAVNIY
jgi:hypothetical protein